jgi:hypothetical protein
MAPLINGIVLALLNILSILFGYWAYYISNGKNQLAVQLISACTFNIFTFILWKFICRFQLQKVRLKTKKHFVLAWVFSIIFSPFLFTFLYFVTKEYPTSFQNILSIWMYQIPTNILLLKLYTHFSKIMDLREKLQEIKQKKIETLGR